MEILIRCGIWGFHSGEDTSRGLLGYDAVPYTSLYGATIQKLYK